MWINKRSLLQRVVQKRDRGRKVFDSNKEKGSLLRKGEPEKKNGLNRKLQTDRKRKLFKKGSNKGCHKRILSMVLYEDTRWMNDEFKCL